MKVMIANFEAVLAAEELYMKALGKTLKATSFKGDFFTSDLWYDNCMNYICEF